MSNFNFSGYAKFQDQPCVHPGKLFDRTDNDAISAVPEGGPAPYGRVLVRGRQSVASTNVGKDLSARHATLTDTCSLPDLNGAYLVDDATGNTYATDAVALPVNGDGDLIVQGIGIYTEHGDCLNNPLAQPFGLGEHSYQQEKSGMVGICQEGNIWAYCETNIDVDDDLFFRTVVTDAADGIQLLGAFSNVGGVGFQPFTQGSVFRGGPAGGAFVVNLNVRK